MTISILKVGIMTAGVYSDLSYDDIGIISKFPYRR